MYIAFGSTKEFTLIMCVTWKGVANSAKHDGKGEQPWGRGTWKRPWEYDSVLAQTSHHSTRTKSLFIYSKPENGKFMTCSSSSDLFMRVPTTKSL